jgi:hypothetical protein
VTYDPNGKISVKDALNTERSYEYDPKFVDIKRTSKATKPSSDGGSVSSSWSYYDDGKILSHTEYPPATETKFDPYDRNLETGRTEAVGIPGVERKIATEWHSDFRVPTRITEPGDRVPVRRC